MPQRNKNDKNVTRLLWYVTAFWLIAGAITCSATCDAATRPDPFFRMTSPSGCSGGWIHASREHGVWGATCEHCVGRSGQSVTVHAFWDGQQSGKLSGTCYGAHPRWDASIIYVPASQFRVLPATTPLAAPNEGPYAGQVVYSIGSFAGNTYTPAVQKMRISRVRDGGWNYYLNDQAWSGHSGGPVIDARTHKLLGNVWGNGQTSIVTSHHALWDIVRGQRKSRGQPMAAVDDDVETVEAKRHTIYVYGSEEELGRCGFLADLRSSPTLWQSFWWVPREPRNYVTPQFVWRDNRGRSQRLFDWPGGESFIAKYEQSTGRTVQQCPPGGCYPGQQQPGNPWNSGPWGGANPQQPLPQFPTQPDNSDEIRELQDKLDRLEREHRRALEDARDESERERRKIQQDHEDRMRELTRELEERQEHSRPESQRQSDPLAVAVETIAETRKRNEQAEQKLAEVYADKQARQEPADEQGIPLWLLIAAAAIGGGLVFAGRKLG